MPKELKWKAFRDDENGRLYFIDENGQKLNPDGTPYDPNYKVGEINIPSPAEENKVKPEVPAEEPVVEVWENLEPVIIQGEEKLKPQPIQGRAEQENPMSGVKPRPEVKHKPIPELEPIDAVDPNAGPIKVKYADIDQRPKIEKLNPIAGPGQLEQPQNTTLAERTPKPEEEEESVDEKYVKGVMAVEDRGIDNLSDYIDELGKRKEEEEKKMTAQENANEAAGRWAGLTELGAGLINLVSVGAGRANTQRHKSFAQDWMRKADEDLRLNNKRRGDMAEAIDKLKLKKQEMQDARDLKELALRYQIEKGKEADAAKAEQAAANYALKLGELNKDLLRIELDGLKSGYVRDPNSETGWKYDKDAADWIIRKYYASHGGNKPRTGSGGGTSSTIRVSFPPFVAGERGTTLNIKPGSLVSTINSNVDLFESEDDKKAVQRILRGNGSADDKAKQLEKYIKSSPQIFKLLKQSADSVEEFNWDAVPEEEEQQPQETGKPRGRRGRKAKTEPQVDSETGIKKYD